MDRLRQPRSILLGAFAGLAVVAGCSARLDTGYEPNKLGDLSPADRKALYAPSFTDASHPPKDNSDNGGGFHEPGSP